MEYNILEAKSAGFFGKEYVLEVKDSKDTDSKIAFVKHNVFERLMHTLLSCVTDYFSGVAGKGVGDLDETDIMRIVKKLNDEPEYSVSLETIKNVSKELYKGLENPVKELQDNGDIHCDPNNKVTVYIVNKNYKNEAIDGVCQVIPKAFFTPKNASGFFHSDSNAKFLQTLNYMVLDGKVDSYVSNRVNYLIDKEGDHLTPDSVTTSEKIFRQFIDSFKE